MGKDKRQLRLQGETLLARTAASLRPLVDETLVAARAPLSVEIPDARMVYDRYPDMGVLAGVHAGLAAARNTWAIVVAGDMPWLNAKLLSAMIEIAMREPCDVVVPRWNGELEPLHALYRAEICARAAETALQQGQRRIVAFYPAVRVREMSTAEISKIAPQGRSFCNINTPQDWQALQAQLKNHT